MADRKTPVLLREGPLSKRIYAVTRYTRKTLDNGREVINAQTKHDVTEDFEALQWWPKDPEVAVQYAAEALLRAGKDREDIVDMVTGFLDFVQDEMQAVGGVD